MGNHLIPGSGSRRPPETPIERALATVSSVAFQYALGGLLLLGVYILCGILLPFLGIITFPYPVFSVGHDPMFALLVSLVMLSVLVMSVSFGFLELSAGTDPLRNGFTLLLSLTAAGFSAGVLQFTLPTAVDALLRIVSI